jgi:dCTP deaminase
MKDAAKKPLPLGSGAVTAPTGVLPDTLIASMIEAGHIRLPRTLAENQLQPASLDLRLGQHAFRVRASFLPGPCSTVMDHVMHMDGLPPINLSHGAVLERGCVYVIEVQESLDLPADITAHANPKSSTGRLDILTRLLVDRGTAFDQAGPGYRGPLYLEVAPQTFSVVVREGTPLTQIRFERGDAAVPSGELRRLLGNGQLLDCHGSPYPDVEDLVPVSIDLRGHGPGQIVGYRAKRHTDKIDLDHRNYPAREFWDPISACDRIVLDPREFYIVASLEHVGVPPWLAAEMIPYACGSGSYRVHYAGFFDPGFGFSDRATGAKAVLEIRAHDVPMMLEHAQTVGWLRYDHMAELPEHRYGKSLHSHYQNQGVALSKHFS